MLISILREIAKSTTHSYDSLAKTLNIDQEMVKQMFRSLLSMGYIISDDPACGDDRCDDCSVCCTKSKDNKPKLVITRWKLTEKGENAVMDNKE